MKKIFLLLFSFTLFLVANTSDDLNITGTKVTYTCDKISSHQTFQYSTWAEGCPAYSKSQAYSFLLSQNDFQENLPECLEPTNPNPPLGETLSQAVPAGYEIVDENITGSTLKYYDGYGSYSSSGNVTPSVSGIRINASVTSGYCSGLSAGITFKTDVYGGIIREENFIRTYHRTCDQNDTTFPALKDQESIIYSWTAPDDLSAQCATVRGDVQHSLLSCVDNYRCTCPYTPYPSMAENEEELFNWAENSATDRSAECSTLGGKVDSSRVACTTLYRCVRETQKPPKECNEPISSYVSPRDSSFHEDIALSGVDFGLHYNSAEWNSTTIAHGWDVSSHAWLVGDRLHYGSGSVRVVDTSTLEGTLTVVLSGNDEMLFDAEGKLQSIRDLYTKETKSTFGYDIMGHLVTLPDIYGEISTIERDGNGTVTAIVAPTGQRTFLSVNDKGDLAEVQYEDTSSYAFEYERHLLTVETEPNGNRFLHFFDDSGNVMKVIDTEQGEWDFSSASDTTQGSHTVTRASGDVVVYTHHFLENNATTLTSQKRLPTGDVVTYANALDDSQSTTSSCGMETVNIYRKNADGTLYKDPYTQRRELQSSSVTTPNGLQKLTAFSTDYYYKNDGTLKRIDRQSTTHSKTTLQRKNLRLHREVNISPLGKRSVLQYDPQMKNLLWTKSYGLHKTYYTYNSEGKVLQETTGDRTTTYTYDNKGNLATSTNALQQTTSYSYDSRDRLIQTTYADGSTEHYSYDANGNQIKRTVPTPAEHTFTYNGVNKRVSSTSPLQNQTTYTYDKQRRITKVTKPSNKTIDTTYTNGRVTSIQTAEGTTNYQYSCQNNISQITKGSESFSFTYDGTLLTSIVQSGLLNESIAYTYNNDFLPTSITYANQTQNYTYSNDNELIQTGNYSISREKRNKRITITDGTYTKTSNINKYGELKKTEDNILSVKLKRNLLGQIVKKVETLNNQRKNIYHYRYGDRGRLVEVKEHKNIVESYTYDSNGNRASATVHNQTITASYTLDDNLVVYGDNTYLYDDDGYLKTKTTPQGATTYSYGTLGELLSVVTPSKTITYKQNANNQRVAKRINGQVVEKYLWANLTTLLAIYDKDDNLVQRFEYADNRMPLSMTDVNGTKYYLHYDQVGSLRAVSRVLSPDNTFEVVKEITYDTFGNILTDSNESFSVPFGFAGGLYDSDTKLTRFGYRDYDAYIGKWTTKDPIGFDGGDSNLYGYVLGDPVNFVDPNGLNAIGDWVRELVFGNPTEEIAKSSYCTAWKISASAGCTRIIDLAHKTCLAVGSPGVVECQKIYRDLYSDCLNERLDCQKKKDTCEKNTTN